MSTIGDLDLNENRYSRQLMLWGSLSQLYLKNASVCILGSCVVAIEVLISLAFNGVGNITIVDDSKIEQADIGKSSILYNKAFINEYCVKAYVTEISKANIDTTLNFIIQSPERFLLELCEDSNRHDFYNVIVLCNIPLHISSILFEYLRNTKKDYFIVVLTSVGFVGMVRIFMNGIYLSFDSDLSRQLSIRLKGLQLHRPLDELVNLSNEIEMSDLDDLTRKHIPFPIILVKAKQIYEEIYTSIYEENSSQILKQIIEKLCRFSNEINFQEAIQNINLLFSSDSSALYDELNHVLLESNKNVTLSYNRKLSLILHAINLFYKEYKRYPVCEKLPDMTSCTSLYLKLQSIYKDQFAKDIDIIYTLICTKYQDINQITKYEIKDLCDHLYTFVPVKYNNIYLSCDSNFNTLTFKNELMEYDSVENYKNQSLLAYYLILESRELFNQKYGRYPKNSIEDLNEVINIIVTYLDKINLNIDIFCPNKDLIKQVIGFETSQIQTTACFIGAIASQEIIKIITNKFVPLNNTLIWSGVSCKCSAFKL
ncbi:thif family protein [Cryptosporidium muris RN66]|uniref:Thif family protein n=1 Tax=Cryptosporidium muris (strain RN66) TaxID=441375 RepID=B6AC46_CRYMR|nr:thif family protein [Cryptosporidium muris RN66]EEA05399.1 thif family protein [Cryptosporidium muris RN66]|eukprot:XP_002139748.1 thif family protein [Cryptosporidium muris RN66]